jgi:hypothetical protein
MSIGSLPFVGVFFCPTRSPGDAELLDKVTDIEGVFRAVKHLEVKKRELLRRRGRYTMKESARNIISEQDLQYEEALREAVRQEEEEKRKEEENRRKEQMSRECIEDAKKRFENLKNFQDGVGSKITIRFRRIGKGEKERDFWTGDDVARLFDFVDIDVAPKKTILKFPGSGKEIRDGCGQALGELGFGRKEIIMVESDDEEE